MNAYIYSSGPYVVVHNIVGGLLVLPVGLELPLVSSAILKKLHLYGSYVDCSLLSLQTYIVSTAS